MNEFRPKYCLENVRSIFPNLQQFGESAVPMVCFCDLPLSATEKHLKFYGEYGIGMRKEWGIKKGINPIMYVCPESEVAKYFKTLINKFLKDINSTKIGDNQPIFESTLELLGFIKPYKGKMYRRGKYKRQNFYNEREWRYVPSLIKLKNANKNITDRLPKDIFLQYPRRIRENMLIGNAFKMSFTARDIKYIIVKKEKEILKMVKAVEKIKGNRYDPDTVKVLSSRIISAEQIKEDF